jgi:hypothetical protein
MLVLVLLTCMRAFTCACCVQRDRDVVASDWSPCRQMHAHIKHTCTHVYNGQQRHTIEIEKAIEPRSHCKTHLHIPKDISKYYVHKLFHVRIHTEFSKLSSIHMDTCAKRTFLHTYILRYCVQKKGLHTHIHTVQRSSFTYVYILSIAKLHA